MMVSPDFFPGVARAIWVAAATLPILLAGWFESRERAPDKDFDIRFGIIEEDDQGFFDVVLETTTIPLLFRETGFSFGYAVNPKQEMPYTTHEVLHLPSPPRHIDFPLPIEKKEGGRIIVTPMILRREPVVYPYSFSVGDPLGAWKLDIYINDRLARSIRFQVVRPDMLHLV